MSGRIQQLAPRTSFVVALLTLLTLTIGAQDVGIRLLEGVLVSAGGHSSQGSVVLTGRLGGAFETRSVSNGDIRILPGLFLKSSMPAGVPGDFDGDGTTGFADFLIFAAAFGTRVGDPAFRTDADFDQSGDIGFSDFLIFAAAFGK